MRYNKYNIKGLSQWCIIQYIYYNKEATNKQMSIDFNCSCSSINDIIVKLKQKDLIDITKSENPMKWRERIYTLK